MIVVQAPLRVSFLGGGTDLAGFYRHEEGCVLSTAIDKYLYVVIKQRFDARIRVGYTRTELVDKTDDVQHDLVRESMRLAGVDRQVELATMGDIPSEGSGLGSSSAVTVGCLNALYTYRGEARSAADLAEQACRIEIGILGRPIGKQDQYILLAWEGRRCLERGEPDALGRLLHEGWLLKRCLASAITSPAIDEMYGRAHRAGAGGGGFLHVPPERQEAVRQALSGLTELPCTLEWDGSKVILNCRR